MILCEEETEEAFLKVASGAHGILFRAKPRASDSLMAACPNLKVIGRHGVGLDTVDIPAATRRGIAVVHAPGSNSQAVAEHALMLMLTCVKRTFAIDKATRKGDWSARQRVGNTELGGKTLGIVGVGNVGRRVAKFAGAIGMKVLGYDPYVSEAELRQRGVEPQKSLEAMLPQVDILTTHTPLTPETRGMINDTTLGLIRRDLHHSRGGGGLRGADARSSRGGGSRRLRGGAEQTIRCSTSRMWCGSSRGGGEESVAHRVAAGDGRDAAGAAGGNAGRAGEPRGQGAVGP